MKKNPQIIALNLAADQCRRLSDFLAEYSAEVSERTPEAWSEVKMKDEMEQLGGFLFKLSEVLEITAQGCQLAAAPKVPAPKVLN